MQKALIRSLTSLAALLVLTASASVLAQDPAGNLTESWVMTVKQGQQAAFEAAMKVHVAVRADSGDPRFWNVYVPATGDEMNRYEIRTCCFGWADQDAYANWYVNNPGVMGDWFTNLDQFIENYAHYFSETDMDNSHWVSEGQPVSLVGVTEFFIAPGQAANFAAAKTELSQIAINQGWGANHNWAWAEQIGGKPVSSLMVPFENYAAMAAQSQNFTDFTSEHMGAEAAAALFGRFSASTSGSQYTIWSYRPDLSTPAAD